jgi:hypothetical protein
MCIVVQAMAMGVPCAAGLWSAGSWFNESIGWPIPPAGHICIQPINHKADGDGDGGSGDEGHIDPAGALYPRQRWTVWYHGCIVLRWLR